MPNALKALTPLLLFAGLGACNRGQDQQNAGDNMVAINNDEGAVANSAGPPADIDTLPADESSTTPSNQLVNGEDAPDVSAANNGSSD